MAVECAPCYFQYGAALFRKAQEDAGVFGAPVQRVVADKDGADGSAQDEEEEDEDGAEEQQGDQDIPVAGPSGRRSCAHGGCS